MAIDEKEILTGDDALAKLRKLLAEFPIAFMITVANGDITARPIGIVGDSEFDGTLWFITDKRSRKVAAIESGATTTLLFQNDKNGDYLQMTGRAAIVDDRAKDWNSSTPRCSARGFRRASTIPTSRSCGSTRTAATTGTRTTAISGSPSPSRSRWSPASPARAATPAWRACSLRYTAPPRDTVYWGAPCAIKIILKTT